MDVKIEMKGFDEAIKKLDDLANRAQQLEGAHRIPATQLFTPAFMRKYTDFESFEAMIEDSGHDVQSAADFERIPDDEWEKLVRARTRFATWTEMLRSGVAEWTKRKMTL